MLERARVPTLQRWTWEELSKAAGDAFSHLTKVTEEKQELKEIYPFRHKIATPRPDQDAWLDNEGLERIRNTKGHRLSKNAVPTGGDKGATHLLKQGVRAWGAEAYELDLLPEGETDGVFDAETKMAVEHFQFFNGLTTDGVVGPKTLTALDVWLEVKIAPTSPDVGGTADRGRTNWDPTRNPIGRVYFETDDYALGMRERQVLEQMALDIAAPWRRVSAIEINVVGYSDKRESAFYNTELSDMRANKVHDYLKESLEALEVDYTLTKEAKGEIERPQVGESNRALKPFRRVDVHFPSVEYRPPPKDIAHDCLEPTKHWLVQIRNAAALGGGATTTTALVDIAMREPDAQGRYWMMTYRYGGFGVGLSLKYMGPLSVGIINNWKPFDTSVALKIWQFGGSARYHPAGVAVGDKGYSRDFLWFYGIKSHGAQAVKVKFQGESTGWGLGVGADLWGRLNPHSRCEQIFSSEFDEVEAP